MSAALQQRTLVLAALLGCVILVHSACEAQEKTSAKASPRLETKQAAEESVAPAWSYEGSSGSSYWANLSPDYAVCSAGTQQSPVDLRELRPQLDFHYQESPLKLRNDGHGIQVLYESGSYIVSEGKRYELKHLEFHRPSEHTVNSQRYPMELQLVHRSKQDKYAIVSVFLQQGGRHPFIDTLWANIPRTAGRVEEVSFVKINASALLPKEREFYTYSGSLTRPPCAEGVRWFVLKAPVNISSSQIAAYTAIYANNARPLQPLHDRQVKG